MPVLSIEDAKSNIGQHIGTSSWISVDQDRINQFADVTEDHQFIHIDPETAKQTPFGTTIAHGFLTLSLLSKMAGETAVILEGLKMGVNYGFDKIRFLEPVASGSRIRGHFTLSHLTEKAPGRFLLGIQVTVEIENNTKPALMAEWLTMQIVG